MPRTFDAAQTLLHIVACNFCASRRAGSLARLSYGFKHQHGKVFSFSISLFVRGKHSMTWHEDSLTWERREEKKSGWDQLYRWNIYQWRHANLNWNASLSPLFDFLSFFDVAQGHLLSTVMPIYAVSEGEVITQDCEGMLFILSPLPATVLEIRLLSEQLKVDACSGRPVWQRPEKRNTTEGTARLWSESLCLTPRWPLQSCPKSRGASLEVLFIFTKIISKWTPKLTWGCKM